MEIKPIKYKALIKGTDTEIIGYLAEISNNEIVMFVSEVSMPNSIHRGTFKIEEYSIVPI